MFRIIIEIASLYDQLSLFEKNMENKLKLRKQGIRIYMKGIEKN